MSRQTRTSIAAEPAQFNARDVLQSLDCGAFWLGKDLTIIGCNHAFAFDCGFDGPEQIEGRSAKVMFPEVLYNRIVAECARLARDDTPRSVNVTELFRSERRDIRTFLVSRLCNSEGDLVGYCIAYGPNQFSEEEERLHRENEEKYRTMFEHSDEGMWLIRDQYFSNANPAAARMLGYENVEELSNLHPSELSPEFQPDGLPSFEKAGQMMALAKQNGRHRFEWDHKKKSGEVFPVDVTLTRVPIDGQDLLLCTWRDITEQKAAQKTLLDARDTAESMTRLKSEFLSNMSHEIRTPMTGILGMLGLIPEGELSERNWDYVQKARMSAQALLNIVNDILDLSRLEAGRMAITISAVDVRRTINQVVDLLENKAHEKGLQLRAEISDAIPATLKLDGRHLRQILLNLAGNAIKFTSSGEVVIAAQFSSDDQGRHILRCSVKDTGIGIPPDKLDAVFDRFQQVDSSVSRSHEGTGLGLSICRELAELHGGSIGVESKPGKGSQFNVVMPVEIGEESLCPLPVENRPTVGKGEPLGQGYGLKNIHVLVAEDNPINQVVISRLLENHNVSHEVKRDGIEVLARLNSPSPEDRPVDIILMDIQMPVMGGVETTAKIRALPDPKLAGLPIVALTANAMAGQGEEYRAAGMNGYVTKPINFDILMGEIKRLCEKKD